MGSATHSQPSSSVPAASGALRPCNSPQGSLLGEEASVSAMRKAWDMGCGR